jgi:hypothetical protein
MGTGLTRASQRNTGGKQVVAQEIFTNRNIRDYVDGTSSTLADMRIVKAPVFGQPGPDVARCQTSNSRKVRLSPRRCLRRVQALRWQPTSRRLLYVPKGADPLRRTLSGMALGKGPATAWPMRSEPRSRCSPPPLSETRDEAGSSGGQRLRPIAHLRRGHRSGLARPDDRERVRGPLCPVMSLLPKQPAARAFPQAIRPLIGERRNDTPMAFLTAAQPCADSILSHCTHCDSPAESE